MSLRMDDSQWPESLFPLKEVDNLLRCGICFDYFNIAMIIPQCSHNYCSLCIRKTLSYKPQCPTCCVAAVASDLKNNRILDDLVKTFNTARQRLFQTVLDPPAILIKKAVVKLQDVNNSSYFSSGVSSTCPRQPETPSTSAIKTLIKVECPACGVPVNELHINKHLDSCLTSDEKKESLRSSGQKRKPLPKVVYNLLSERDLRKRLKQYGLFTQGTKQQLIKRHKEFVHMYNAECDSLNPKSVEEIVKELGNNEKTQAQLESKVAGKDRLTFPNHLKENEIDEMNREYRKKHKAEFQLLINKVKKQKKKTNKTKIKEEEPQQKEAAAEKLPLEIGEKQSDAGHPDCAVLTDEPVKKEALDCASFPTLLCSEARGSILLSSSPSSGSSNSSSSDIIRDLEIAGISSCSSDSNSVPAVKTAKKKSRDRRSSSLQSRTRSKRRKE